MPVYESFSDWINSSYYPLINNNTEPQKLFVQSLVAKLQIKPDDKVLEVGCRLGENSKEISEKGFDVTGVDFSQVLIDKAKALENDHLQFFQHDIRLPFWINYFDTALLLFNNFGYYNTLREHDNAIRAISQSLKTEGVFVMDYLNVHYEEDNLQESEELQIAGQNFQILRRQDDETFYKKISLVENQEIKELFTEKYLKLSIGDFTDMFAYQGLQIQEVFGDYQFADYDIRKSPRLIFIAKKIRR